MGKLEGKVAIVTGGSSGIGAATASKFAAEGAQVIAGDIVDKPAHEAGILGVPLDVSSAANWEKVVAETMSRYGKIDILINNAGMAILKKIVDLTPDEFDRVINVNLKGVFLGLKYVGAAMMTGRGGSIVNISSSAGLEASNAFGAYSASKWGVRGITKVAALEMGLSGVRVNSVHPGPTLTGLTNPGGAPAASFLEHPLARMQPIQRFAAAEEIARVNLFLASDDAAYVTGAEIAVDGGMTIGRYMPWLPGAPTTAANTLTDSIERLRAS